MDSERLQGQQRLRLFKNLLKDRTVLNLHIIGTDYERLTILTDQVSENGTPYIIIDYPEGFSEAVKKAGELKFLIQFMARDKINYSFRTTFKKLEGEDIWLKFPDFIERIQRRKHFRIAPPLGSNIVFISGNIKCHANVVNLSLGGVLAALNPHTEGNVNLYKDEHLSDILFLCKEKSLKLGLHIQKAIIKRVEKIQDTGKLQFALQFVEMGKQDRNILNNWITKCQREFLKKRNFLDGS